MNQEQTAWSVEPGAGGERVQRQVERRIVVDLHPFAFAVGRNTARNGEDAGEQIRSAADPTPTQKLTDPGVVQPRPYFVNPRRPPSHVDSLTARRGEATYLPLCNTRSGSNEVPTPGVLTR